MEVKKKKKLYDCIGQLRYWIQNGVWTETGPNSVRPCYPLSTSNHNPNQGLVETSVRSGHRLELDQMSRHFTYLI